MSNLRKLLSLVRQISLLFSIQQAAVVYRPRINFVSKGTQTTSIASEEISAIYIQGDSGGVTATYGAHF
jgi:hypothetical protein